MSFSSPYLLVFLLLVPLVAALAVWFDRRRAKYAVAFTNLDVLASVVSPRRRARRWIPLVLFLLALAAASTALARPRASVSEPAQRATLVLLVDVSGSMRASDVKPSRLGAAQEAMTLFADKVPKQVKIGLVSFSTSPDVLVIPTTDRGILHEGIDLLTPEAGTAIGDGLGVAVQVAQSALGSSKRGPDGKVPAAIVLLSDGLNTQNRWYSNASQIDARQKKLCDNAKAANITIYTVQVNTGSDPTSSVLQYCASTTDKFYLVTSASQTVSVFKDIGTSLSKLRVAR